MKIDRMDIFNNSTLAFNMLKAMSNEAKTIQARANRIMDTNQLLIHYIQEGKITDSADIDCAQAWLNHSDLTPEEILCKVLGED